MPTKEYYWKHKKELSSKQKIYYREHLGEEKSRRKKWRDLHKDYISQKEKEKRLDLKFSVFAIYSDAQPKCACCGETIFEFLSLDHINGTGKKYGKKFECQTLTELLNWITKHNFPRDYRILCYNCNCSIGFNGYCPHHPN